LNKQNPLKDEVMENISSGFSGFCRLAEKPGGMEDVGHWASDVADYWPLFLIVPEKVVMICNHLLCG